MRVPVVQVRVVRVAVVQRFMAMPMAMWLTHRLVMRVLVMLVVDVAVFMLDGVMHVHMAMPLGEMKV